MKKKLGLVIGAALPFVITALAWAEEAAAAAPVSKGAALNYFIWTSVAIAIGFSITTGICGLGQGIAIQGGLQGIARQPEASDKIQIAMLLGLAFIESLALFALFIHIVFLFANPFLKFIQ